MCAAAAFSIRTLRSGAARSSVCVDISSSSLELAAEAAAANGVQQQLLLQKADALQWLLHRTRHLALQPSCTAPQGSLPSVNREAASIEAALGGKKRTGEVPVGGLPAYWLLFILLCNCNTEMSPPCSIFL